MWRHGFSRPRSLWSWFFCDPCLLLQIQRKAPTGPAFLTLFAVPWKLLLWASLRLTALLFLIVTKWISRLVTNQNDGKELMRKEKWLCTLRAAAHVPVQKLGLARPVRSCDHSNGPGPRPSPLDADPPLQWKRGWLMRRTLWQWLRVRVLQRLCDRALSPSDKPGPEPGPG